MKKTLDKATRQAVGKVIEDNLDYLVRFAALRLGNLSDAEDVVHEAVRKFLEKDVTQVKNGSMRMYLFRIVYNLCSDYHLRTVSCRGLSTDDYDIPDTSRDDDADSDEIERLNGVLDNLPDKEAEVIRMNVIDGLSFVEISSILSAPSSTVKSRFKSGMEKLRDQYRKKL